jgi:hypothetical protein
MDLSQLTPAAIDTYCPPTAVDKDLANISFPNTVQVTYTLPKFTTLKDTFDLLVYPDASSPYYSPLQAGSPGDPVIVNISEGASLVPHQVFMGMAIACSTLAVRPLILVKTALDGFGNPRPGVNTPQSYNPNTAYMCIRWADPLDNISKWFCGAGGMGDGVVGVATIEPNPSPRSFFVKNLTWGQNTWSRHWEWKNVLQAVSTRDWLPSGFASDNAWNLNPNDFHSDASSKGPTYLAAIALKTLTNRSGVHVSPYHTRNVQDAYAANPLAVLDTLALAAQRPGELNQGEIETSSCGTSPYPSAGCTDYFSYFESASEGKAGTCNSATCVGDMVGVIDTKISQYYQNLANSDPVICSYGADWKVSTSDVTANATGILPIQGKNWAADRTGATSRTVRVPLTTVPYALAINRATSEVQRCPSWKLCDNAVLHNVFLIAYNANWTKLTSLRDPPFKTSLAASYVRFGGFLNGGDFPFDTKARCDGNPRPAVNTSDPCLGFYCGMPIPAVTANKDLVDWYVCSGSSCGDAAQTNNVWTLACSGTYKCSIPMRSDDTYIVALPTSLRSTAFANLAWARNNGL